jgi:hypothetical protein
MIMMENGDMKKRLLLIVLFLYTVVTVFLTKMSHANDDDIIFRIDYDKDNKTYRRRYIYKGKEGNPIDVIKAKKADMAAQDLIPNEEIENDILNKCSGKNIITNKFITKEWPKLSQKLYELAGNDSELKEEVDDLAGNDSELEEELDEPAGNDSELKEELDELAGNDSELKERLDELKKNNEFESNMSPNINVWCQRLLGISKSCKVKVEAETIGCFWYITLGENEQQVKMSDIYFLPGKSVGEFFNNNPADDPESFRKYLEGQKEKYPPAEINELVTICQEKDYLNSPTTSSHLIAASECYNERHDEYTNHCFFEANGKGYDQNHIYVDCVLSALKRKLWHIKSEHWYKYTNKEIKDGLAEFVSLVCGDLFSEHVDSLLK